CAGHRAAGPAVGDEPLLRDDEGLKEAPARGASRPPPAHIDDPQPAARPATPDEAAPEASQGPQGPQGLKTGDGPVPYAGPRGTIRRPELIRLLDANPAAFLRRVDSERRFESGRFRGWHINAFFTGDTRFS